METLCLWGPPGNSRTCSQEPPAAFLQLGPQGSVQSSGWVSLRCRVASPGGIQALCACPTPPSGMALHHPARSLFALDVGNSWTKKESDAREPPYLTQSHHTGT